MKYLLDTNVISEVRKGPRYDERPVGGHGLTLVTRNVPDVGRTGVDALNPWNA